MYCGRCGAFNQEGATFCESCGGTISAEHAVVSPPGGGRPYIAVNQTPGYRTCPRCGGFMQIQPVEEEINNGCGLVILYFLLAITILGILVLIPILLREKKQTRLYAICQMCGYYELVS